MGGVGQGDIAVPGAFSHCIASRALHISIWSPPIDRQADWCLHAQRGGVRCHSTHDATTALNLAVLDFGGLEEPALEAGAAAGGRAVLPSGANGASRSPCGAIRVPRAHRAAFLVDSIRKRASRASLAQPGTAGISSWAVIDERDRVVWGIQADFHRATREDMSSEEMPRERGLPGARMSNNRRAGRWRRRWRIPLPAALRITVHHAEGELSAVHEAAAKDNEDPYEGVLSSGRYNACIIIFIMRPSLYIAQLFTSFHMAVPDPWPRCQAGCTSEMVGRGVAMGCATCRYPNLSTPAATANSPIIALRMARRSGRIDGACGAGSLARSW